MSKMIIYFCLFIPLLFLSADSSSIRGRNHKNDLVPFLSSRFDAMKRDPNSLKVVSKDPFIIQLHMPNSKEMEARGVKDKDKKRKRPMKKRISKLKPLRKKHRKRRDLFTSKTKPREEKPFRFEIPRAANNTERQLKNSTRNSVNRMEILKALSYYPKKTETKRNKIEGTRNVKDEEKINIGKTKKNNTSNRNLHKHHLSLSDRSKLAYPSTPKLDRRPQRYTYKDLMADRERLEQKIKYIKNMLNANVTTDDGTRVRRRSDSDRTANKIAKMFLTLSAVNGLHDKRKSKCNDDDYDDDDDNRTEDVWEKERRNNPLRKSTSSNEERYKVKKWIEFMKNKRSSGKICPCMRDSYGDESDAFPLEQKLPKGYFLMERGRSSEESSESFRDPYYYSTDKVNKNENLKQRLSKSQEQDIKNKAQGKNGKKRLEVPYEDLELYRTRARQILRNAEEILDKIKEEEEKRLAMPNILMSQLKELTARIHGDPRNNENDLIRKIQKNLGWGPLSTPQEETDGTFMDNVKSFILDPYEKAKALTDESTKKLSSYLLRNLGKLQESSKEQPSKTDDGTLKINLGELSDKEEKPLSATLAKEEPRADLSKSKEDLQNWEDTLSAILGGGGDTINKENNWNIGQELSPQEVEDTVKDAQQKLNVNKVLNSKEVDTVKDSMKFPQLGEDNKPESILEEKIETKALNEKEDYNTQDTTGFPLINGKDEKEIKSVEEPGAILGKKLKNPDNTKTQPFREMEGAFQGKKGESDVQASRNMQEEEEEEERVAMTLNQKENDDNKQDAIEFRSKDEKEIKNVGQGGQEETTKNSDLTKKQPFLGTEGTLQRKKEESNAEASQEVREQEERLSMTINDKGKDDGKLNTEEFRSKEEKEQKSSEEPRVIFQEPKKDSDIIKKPFRDIEGTFQGEEGESEVQASRDMQEKEKFKKEFGVVKMLSNNENPKTDEVVQKSNVEEKDVNEDAVDEISEKQEEKKNVPINASSELEKTASKEKTPGDSTADERVEKKSDATFPSITLIDESSPTDSGLDSLVKSEEKEIVRADLADEFESNEESVSEKQKELNSKKSEEELKIKDEKLENFKESTGTQKEEETPISLRELLKESRKEVPPNEEILQKEIGTKTLPEYADLVQDGEPVSEMKQNEEGDSEEERRMRNEEILELNNEKNIRKENIEEKLESISRKDSIEDLNPFLKATLDQEHSSLRLHENFSRESDDDVLLKETITDDQKNESLEEDIKDKLLKDSQEILANRKNKPLLSAEQLHDDSQSSVENNDDSFLKESNPHKAFDSVKEGSEIYSRETLNKQDQDTFETQEYQSSEVNDGSFVQDSSGMNLKASSDKNKDLDKDDEVNLKASLHEEEDLEKDDEVNLKASMDKDEESEKDDEVNLKASLHTDEESEKDDEVNLKASMDKDEDLEKDDEVNLKASLHEEEDLEKDDEANLKASLHEEEESEKDDEVNLKASLHEEEDLEKDDEVNLKASMDKDEESEKDDEVNLKASMDKDEDLEKDDEVNLKASLHEEEDLEKDDEANLKASLHEEEDLEKDDEVNLKANMDKDEESEKDDEVNLKASMDKDEESEKDDEVNLKASLHTDEESEKDDEVNLKASMDKDEDLEKDDEANLKASMDKDKESEKDDEVNLKASMDKDEDLEKDDEVNLKASLHEEEVLEKDDEANLKASLHEEEDLEKDDEENLKASMDKDEDLEKDDRIILKASNRYGLEEIQNLSEEKYAVSLKENQENNYQTESFENVEKVLDAQKQRKNKDEKSTDPGMSREIETLEKAMNIHGEATDSEKNQNAENINLKDHHETIVRAKKPDENVNIKDEEANQESLKFMNSKEMEYLKDRESEEIVKETNPEENVQDEKSEILEEILKEIQNQKQKSEPIDEDDQVTNKPLEDEYLEPVLKNETQENLEEPDEKILKAGKADNQSVRSREEPNLEATLEGQDKDFVLKEINIDDLEEKKDDLEDGEKVKAVFYNREQFDEISQKFDEDKRENHEGMDNEKILQKTESFEEELNDQNHETLKSALEEHVQENLGNSENQQAENPEADEEKDDGETPLRSASLEDEFDNKIDYENPFKSAQSLEETESLESMRYINEDETKDTLRAGNAPQDLSNQIDEKKEVVLKSTHFDPKSPDGNGYSYLTVVEDNVEAKSPLKASNREDANSQENLQERGPLVGPQKPDLNSLKASKLKVPKWIGKIMKDLNGKEKTDVTAIQNLNPDKIDDMLGKIGKAEQQNLLEHEEVDCRKECACAEEMNTRSRNIGRYEIVKDFLHWVKDLQLNRVLSDE